MTKLDCFRSRHLLVGLNCFEPGQEQTVHAHDGADKFYFVVTGKARFTVGDRTLEARSVDHVRVLERRTPARLEPLDRRAPPAILERVDQLLARPLLSCQDSVRVESVAALIQVGDAHPQQLLEERRHRSLVHYGAEVPDHRPEVVGPERHGPKHVGNVAALLEVRLADRPHVRRHVARRQGPDAWITHGVSGAPPPRAVAPSGRFPLPQPILNNSTAAREPSRRTTTHTPSTVSSTAV